jgi:hypothetical protein
MTPNLSLHYQDTLSHGVFNPNAVFYSPTYEQAPQREPRPSVDGAPFTGRRGPLEFYEQIIQAEKIFCKIFLESNY